MSRLIELNREFYDHMGWSYPDSVECMGTVRRAELMAYIISEVLEFGNSSTTLDQMDSLADAMYFIVDAFLEIGIDPEDVYKIIHRSNMAKKWPTSGARLDTSVVPPKLIKPPSWVSPKEELDMYLMDVINNKVKET